jgi:hypothetical protein
MMGGPSGPTADPVTIEQVRGAFAEIDTRHDGAIDRRELYRALRTSKLARELFGVRERLEDLSQDAQRSLVESIVSDIAAATMSASRDSSPLRSITWPMFMAYFCERKGIACEFVLPVQEGGRAIAPAKVALCLRQRDVEVIHVGGRTPIDLMSDVPDTSVLVNPQSPLARLHRSHHSHELFSTLASDVPGVMDPHTRGSPLVGGWSDDPSSLDLSRREAEEAAQALLRTMVQPTDMDASARPLAGVVAVADGVRKEDVKRSTLFREVFRVMHAFRGSDDTEMTISVGELVVKAPNPNLDIVGADTIVPVGWEHVFRVSAALCG